MKKVLIIGFVWPEPNSSAAGSRMMELIAFFQSQQCQITFACPAQQTEHMVDLPSLGVETKAILLNSESFDVFLQELQPSIVLFDRFMIEEQFGWRVIQQCPNALRLLDTEDFFSLRHARHNAYKNNTPMTDIDLLKSDMAKREVAAIFRCDLTLMISSVEIDLLVRLFKVDASLLHYVPFMFDENQFNLVNPTFDQREHFISIGNFRHAPNWDSVLRLKQEIWPLIRKKLPKAQLHICGAYPPPKATQLHDEKSGFLVKGWVDDAELVMQQAKICLAPLRFGAGIKGKLAQAMICGTPSVTTTIGAESMESEKPWGGAIHDEAAAIADAAVELYENPILWQEASNNGQQNAVTLYDHVQHFEKLEQIIDNLLNDLENHRQLNFIGGMLNHHHHKSTQYMSQWIEVKNKLAEHNK